MSRKEAKLLVQKAKHALQKQSLSKTKKYVTFPATNYSIKPGVEE